MDHQWGDWHEDSYHDDAANPADDGSSDPHADDFAGLGAEHDPGLADGYDQPTGGLGHDPDAGFADAGYPDAGYPDDDPMGHYSHDLPEPIEPVVSDSWTDPFADGTGLVHETLVGADPDVSGLAGDPGWEVAEFPEPLHIEVPEPVDGFPWTDPGLLGHADVPPDADDPAAHGAGGEAAPEVSDLLDYAGLDSGAADPWAALLGSDDPATNTLARWWAPGG